MVRLVPIWPSVLPSAFSSGGAEANGTAGCGLGSTFTEPGDDTSFSRSCSAASWLLSAAVRIGVGSLVWAVLTMVCRLATVLLNALAYASNGLAAAVRCTAARSS